MYKNLIISILTFFLFLAVWQSPVLSQTQSTSSGGFNPEEKAKAYGITFPISELGNCGDLQSCRTYCEDPVNLSACIDYAKSKGFYKEELEDKKDKILEKAKTQLGCDSYQSCMNFCEIPANYDKCNSFAKSEGMSGGVTEDPTKIQIIEKAKEILGCSNANECASFCSQDENREKCSNFAKEVGIRGGEQKVGPGGCTSEQTCKAFCSIPENYQICSGFTSTAGGTFTGPGGCNSQSSCQTYCEKNPTECGYRNDRPPEVYGNYNAQEMCNRTPNCSWSGNTCQCGFYGETEETARKAAEYGVFCRENPDKCRGGQPGMFESPQQRQEFENFCRDNPEKCRMSTGGSYENFSDNRYVPDNMKVQCERYGCSWNGSSCQCSGITSTYGSGYTGGSNTVSRDQQEAGCRAGGGTCDWNSGVCNCRGYTSPSDTDYSGGSSSSYNDPAAVCARSGPGCYWTNSSCFCPSTQNTSGTTGTTNTSGGYWGGSYEDPATACTRGGGCSWTGTSCQCPTSSGSNSTYMDPATACASSGCSWNGSSCQCSTNTQTSTDQSQTTLSTPTDSGSTSTTNSDSGSTSSPPPSDSGSTQTQPVMDPATACAQMSGCSWNGSTCQCGSTQGVSTSRNIFQIILDWFNSLRY